MSDIHASQRTLKVLPNIEQFLPNFLAGIIVGIVTLIYSISAAALIFSGTLSQYFSIGLGSALVCAVLSAIIVALRSSLPNAIAGADLNGAAILAVMASEIASQLQGSESLFPTVWIVIVLTTTTTGVALFVLGRLRLGTWVRFVPYPVLGGFLAASGWLLVLGSFKVMVGQTLKWSILSDLFEPELLWRWLPGMTLAILLLIAGRYKHYLTIPGLLVGSISLFHLVWSLGNGFQADPHIWFIKPFPRQELWQAWQVTTFTKVDWSVLIGQTGNAISVVAVVALGVLFNATALELTTKVDGDLDRELQANGIANLIVGCSGGLVSALTLNRSILGYLAGATRPLAGLTVGGFCAVVMMFGSDLLSIFPNPILGGLLLYSGLSLLIQWLYTAWFKLPHLDYALIVAIAVIASIWGFIQGVVAGIVIACLIFVYNYSQNPSVKYAFSGAIRQSNHDRSLMQQNLLRDQGSQTYVLSLQGHLFFGTSNSILEQIKHRLLDKSLQQLRYLVLDFRRIHGLDSSAVSSFAKLVQISHKFNFHLVFTAVPRACHKQLFGSNIIDVKDNMIEVFPDLDRGLEWCEDRILSATGIKKHETFPLAMQLSEVLIIEESIPDLLKDIKYFASYLEKIELDSGKFVFRQGDISDGLYFVESGLVTMYLELPDGSQKRLRTMYEGTVVGEVGLYKHQSRSASVVTNSPTVLYFLSRTALDKMETAHPKIAAAFHHFIVRQLSDRLNQAYSEIENLLKT